MKKILLLFAYLILFSSPLYADDEDTEPMGVVPALSDNNIPLPNARQVNVKQFGAKGDGVTDDGPAIQKAINSLGAAGGVVFIPAGLYMLGTSAGSVDTYPDSSVPVQNALLITNSNIILAGQVGRSILMLMPNTKMRMMAITGTQDSIIDIVFDGNKSNRNGSQPFPGGDVVSSMINGRETSADLVFFNLEIRNGLEDGIGLWDSPRAKVLHCYSHDNGTSQAGATGFSISGPLNMGSVLINSIAEGNSTANVWLSFGPRNVLVRHNLIENGARTGISIGGSSPAHTPLSTGIVIVNNQILHNKSFGLNIVSSQDGILAGNEIIGNGNGGAVGDQGTIPSQDWRVENNVWDSNGWGLPQGFGVSVTGISHGIKIRGNSFINNGISSHDQVAVEAAGAVNADYPTVNKFVYNNTGE